MSGCSATSKPVVKVVKIDSFCEGKYTPLTLEDRDFVVISKIRQSDYFIPTMNKFIKYLTVNTKEHKICDIETEKEVLK